jgi:hypothetical protein
MTESRKMNAAREEIEKAIQEAITDTDFSKHKRKKRVRRSWMSVPMNREIMDSQHAKFIREGLHFDIGHMLDDLKDGKVIIPEFHDTRMNGYCEPDWRHQFIASSSDGEHHVLVTMEQCLWDLEIAFEIEVEA